MRTLLFRLFTGALLGEREALGLFATCGAFPYVVSALAVSHKTFTFAHLPHRSNAESEPFAAGAK